MSVEEARTHDTFMALMWGLSYPGRTVTLPTTGLSLFFLIAESLVDLETSYYTPDIGLHQQVAQLGARAFSSALAAYQFYPQLDEAGLAVLRQAPVGSHQAPDEAATLVLGVEFGSGQRLRLSGPGVQEPAELSVHGLPEAFWSSRQAACHYPLGWDVFLVGGDRVVGLPRTTVVEVIGWPT
jgi:alpha-D-ribose 1-methylphosphonate 5-triphosphate synthase subunit PhnH